jgi:thiamine biosynthesis lipoprotein
VLAFFAADPFGAAFFAGREAVEALPFIEAALFATRFAGFVFAGAAAWPVFLAGRLLLAAFAGRALAGAVERLARDLPTTRSVPGPGMIELSPPVSQRIVTIEPVAAMTTPSLGADFDVNETRSPTSAIGYVLSLANARSIAAGVRLRRQPELPGGSQPPLRRHHETALVEELRFRAMGTDVHVISVGGRSGLAVRARDRIDALERLWSRFLPDSEISELTRRAGSAVVVSDETAELITRAVEAWRFTAGTFDPTVLGAVLRAGYTESFERLDPTTAAGTSGLLVGCTDIELHGNVVTLPPGTGFDPGGIGKGLAADLVAAEMVDAGAAAVCVNIGGDLRTTGQGPDGDGWTIAVEHPWSPGPIANVGISDGAVATSTTLRRRWTVDGEERHHLIDPRTGEPAATDLNLVTVIAGSAWAAEVLAKAVLIRGSAHPFDIVDGTGAQALIVDDKGRVTATEGFRGFLGDGWLPENLPREH